MPPAVKKKLSSYRELLVWQKAMDLVVSSYAWAGRLPQSELFALGSQFDGLRFRYLPTLVRATDGGTLGSTLTACVSPVVP
jgi:hypothetical protein